MCIQISPLFGAAVVSAKCLYGRDMQRVICLPSSLFPLDIMFWVGCIVVREKFYLKKVSLQRLPYSKLVMTA